MNAEPLHGNDAGAVGTTDSSENPDNQSAGLSVKDITSQSEFDNYTADNLSTLLVIYFHASWAEPCKHLSSALETLAATYTSSAKLAFLRIDADDEDLSDIAENYEVSAVPYIALQKNLKVIETISSPSIATVRATVEKHAGRADGNPGKFGLPPAQQVQKPVGEQSSKNLSDYAPGSSDPTTAPQFSAAGMPEQQQAQQESKEELNARLGELVKAAPVMLFMKGTPSAPQCGFSRQTVALLREKGVRYGFFNILADDDVRQGLKEFSEWPTFPQVYCDGELVGGLDIVGFTLSFLGCSPDCVFIY